QAPQGVGARGAGRARPPRAVAAGRAAGRAAPRGLGLARRLSALLGRAAGPVRRVPAFDPGNRARRGRSEGREAPRREEQEGRGAVMDGAMVREISITRIFGAPRDRVWRGWREAEQLARWFMPHGFTVPECEVDLRPGGRFSMTVRAPDGSESPTGGEFREIDPPQRLVFTTTGFDGPDGVPMLEVLNTATFADLGDKTELTLHAVITKASPEMAAPLAGMEEGWLQSLEKLDGLLTGREVDSSERAIVATCVLDAPRETVWKLWTDPAHVFTTVGFADEDGKTGVTIRALFPSAADRERAIREYGAADGLEQNMDKLAEYVAQRRTGS